MSPTVLIVTDPVDRVLRVRFGAEETSHLCNRAGQQKSLPRPCPCRHGERARQRYITSLDSYQERRSRRMPDAPVALRNTRRRRTACRAVLKRLDEAI